MIHRVAYNLTKNRKKLNEKVGGIMGGQVLDLPEFKIFDDGVAKGKAEGESNGIRIFIEDKIEDGIPEEKIIDKLKKKYGMTEKLAKDWLKNCIMNVQAGNSVTK